MISRGKRCVGVCVCVLSGMHVCPPYCHLSECRVAWAWRMEGEVQQERQRNSEYTDSPDYTKSDGQACQH